MKQLIKDGLDLWDRTSDIVETIDLKEGNFTSWDVEKASERLYKLYNANDTILIRRAIQRQAELRDLHKALQTLSASATRYDCANRHTQRVKLVKDMLGCCEDVYNIYQAKISSPKAKNTFVDEYVGVDENELVKEDVPKRTTRKKKATDDTDSHI